VIVPFQTLFTEPITLPGVLAPVNYVHSPPFGPTLAKREGSVLLGFPTPFPLVLWPCSLLVLLLAVKHIPKPGVYESLTPEYLVFISWTLLIFVAVLAKELLKILSAKVKDSLTLEVF